MTEDAEAPKEKSKNTHEHDKIFRMSMQEKKVAIDLLQANLPTTVLEKIDISTLASVSDTFVENSLQRFQSDCVLSCKISGKDGYLLFCAEHQSSADKMMAFRVLQYVVAIMGHHLKQGHDRLPIVVPLVVYHGIQSPYPYSTDIWDCFENPELAKQLALKPFQLFDLTILSDEEIKQHGVAAGIERSFKHCRDENAAWVIKMIFDGIFSRIYHEVGVNYYWGFCKYIYGTFGNKQYPEELQKVTELLISSVPEMREDIMTFSEQLREQGAQKGMQQEKHEVAKRMLNDGIDREMIKRYTGLSENDLLTLH